MSNLNFNTDLLKLLELDSSNHHFLPVNYPNTDSCIKIVKDGVMKTKYVHIVSHTKVIDCPHCGTVNNHESKGLRSIYLTHKSEGTIKTVLDVYYRRFKCKDCHQYFKETIPFRFNNMRISNIAAQCILHSMQENTAMAVISREKGVSRNLIYRLFHNHIKMPLRYYQLPSVLSIDEFRATTNEGIFAFNIVNPITGKTIDILPDRKHSALRNYFIHFTHQQRNAVKIIVMDLSSAFYSIMKSLFPNAQIIADKFHYVRIVRNNMIQTRIQNCKKMKNKSLAKLIKRNLHLFDQYHERLNHDRARYIKYFNKYMTNKQLVETILEQDEVDVLYEGYRIYQNFLDILHKPHNDYKSALNDWLEYIFETKNNHFIGSAKNFRKNWFLPILRSLTFKAVYLRNGKKYTTSYNNGFIESMNNKVKLVKRNAYGFSKFENLRKRILMHLGFHYEIV